MTDSLWHGNDDPPHQGAAVVVDIDKGEDFRATITGIYDPANGGELWWHGKKLPIDWKQVSKWRLAW